MLDTYYNVPEKIALNVKLLLIKVAKCKQSSTCILTSKQNTKSPTNQLTKATDAKAKMFQVLGQ
jgi:hypothetical protein